MAYFVNSSRFAKAKTSVMDAIDRSVVFGVSISLAVVGWIDSAWSNEENVVDFDIEALMNIEVTSVSKQVRKLSDSAAAIFVITQEDIRRSGATSVPEVLRLAPGVNVARIDGYKWAVSARGFNGRFANKLLVLVDGRTVYSPAFSGVYWEASDLMLEDIERIEVIRGPGATLWGANAVNGVINIISRHAADTQGSLVTAMLGDEIQGQVAVRAGRRFAENSYARIYLKTTHRDETERASGGDAGDEGDTQRGGFRVDLQSSYKNNFTFQGDFYRGEFDQQLLLPDLAPPFMNFINDTVETDGWNLLGRWRHTQSADSEFTLQTYYDFNNRDEGFVDQTDKTLDIELQHLISSIDRHLLIWGVGYRYFETYFNGSVATVLGDTRRDDEVFNFFIQDEITLVNDSLWLTLGSKFERNDYTDTEIQPSVRLMWSLADNQKLWLGASRAARVASRVEHDVDFLQTVVPPVPPFIPPVVVRLIGDDGYDSEQLTAWEIGYRVTFSGSLMLDFAAFYNDYDDLRSVGLEPPVFMGTYVQQSIRFNNNLSGDTHGLELSAVWQPTETWRWDLAYSYLEQNFDARSVTDELQNGEAPRHQASLRSQYDLANNIELDIWLRYTDQAHAVDGRNESVYKIDAYLSADVRLAWRPNKNLELALVGKNLLDPAHPEYIEESFTLPTEIERSISFKIMWQPW